MSEETKKPSCRSEIKDWNGDKRTKRGWWAPGDYICHCRICLKSFIGDKRAGHCSDCAYKEGYEL